MKHILFLCTGNYYRSRFAEIFFNWQVERQGLLWKAESRGFALDEFNPGPMSRNSLARLKLHGIPTEAYQRLPLGAAHDDFKSADHVVAVKETEHRPLMQARFPECLEKVEFWEVHDLDCVGPDVALPHLEREVLALIKRLENPAFHQSIKR